MSSNLIKNIALVVVLSLLFFTCKKESNVADAPMLEVGQHYGGGVVFYIDGSGEHGLIAAEQDVNAKVKWSDTCCQANAFYQEIGRGNDNTKAIINVFGQGNYAASVCRQLNLNGYNDWFLPSKNELNLLYQKRSVVGGFSDGYYWSSSEQDSLHAWYSYFPYGPQYYINKDTAALVRAIRAF